MSRKPHSVEIRQHVDAPAARVSAFISEFRNSREWMVGVESIDDLGDDADRLTLESPIGKLEPTARIVDRGPEHIRWVYTSTLDGSGRVHVSPSPEGGCIVDYAGEFHLKSGIADRLARAAGLERFAHRNGERSLLRLKALMEARRYG